MSEGKQIDINEYKINKDNNTKKLFVHFQKQIFNLFSELIIFCFKEGIIKINNTILQENILTKAGFISSKSNINPQNEKETQKFLIHSVIYNKVNCTIYPSDYIKFFNSENAIKKRTCAQRFMKFIKHMIIIYKESKKHPNIKRVVNTEQKVCNSEKIIGSNNRLIEERSKLTFQNIKKFGKDDSSKSISSSEKSIIMNNEADNDEENDTINGATPKNINNNYFIKKCERKTNNIIHKTTATVVNAKNNLLAKNDLKFLSQRNTHFLENHKQKFKLINNKSGNKNQKYNRSLYEDKNDLQKSSINNTQNFINNYNCLKNYNNFNNNNNEEDLAGCNII